MSQSERGHLSPQCPLWEALPLVRQTGPWPPRRCTSSSQSASLRQQRRPASVTSPREGPSPRGLLGAPPLTGSGRPASQGRSERGKHGQVCTATDPGHKQVPRTESWWGRSWSSRGRDVARAEDPGGRTACGGRRRRDGGLEGSGAGPRLARGETPACFHFPDHVLIKSPAAV